ncbi:MAG: GNAT family N-acetyltransferase [Pirellula sp.]|nr:GNAT family N-acetyltransferase [Pirellula sp.]
MPIVYFKRYRMHFDLRATPIPAEFPREKARDSIVYLGWDERLVAQHGLAKWESFRREMDVNVFPCLGDRDGCKQLMRDIAKRENFVPESTWLAVQRDQHDRFGLAVGTIQGLRVSADFGAIQNIGVLPSFRGMGVGRELIRRNLIGFRDVGCRKVQLEVTIHNFGAIRLYESMGFRRAETVFKIGNVPVA